MLNIGLTILIARRSRSRAIRTILRLGEVEGLDSAVSCHIVTETSTTSSYNNPSQLYLSRISNEVKH